MDPALSQGIADALAENAGDPLAGGPDSETVEVDPSPLYDEAREMANAKRGFALATAWAVSGRIRNSIVSADSVDRINHNLWVAGQYRFAHSANLLGTVQWKEVNSEETSTRVGLAIRFHLPQPSLAGEVYKTWLSAPGLDDPFGLGVNGEVPFIGPAVLVGSLTTEPAEINGDTKSRLRVRTALRVNSGH